MAVKEGQAWLNEKETAAHFGVDVKTVRAWADRENDPLPSVYLPGQRTWKVRAADADRWAKQAGRRTK